MRSAFLTLLVSLTMFSSLYAASIRFASYNIENFDYDDRSHRPTDMTTLAATVQSLKTDLIGFEEVVNVPAFQHFIATALPSHAIATVTQFGGSHNQRLAFVYSKATIVAGKMYEDARFSNKNTVRPAAIGFFTHLPTKTNFVAVALHLKAGGNGLAIRQKQYQLLTQLVKELHAQGHMNVVVMGDMNTTEFDAKGAPYKVYASLMKSVGLIDYSEALPCTSYWWGNTDDGVDVGSTLDHILISQEFLQSFPKGGKALVHAHCALRQCQPSTPESLGLTYSGVSDHCPITLDLFQ